MKEATKEEEQQQNEVFFSPQTDSRKIAIPHNKRNHQQKYLEYGQKILKQLFKQHQAKELSLEYRQIVKETIGNDRHLTYGEVESSSFLRILSIIDAMDPIKGKTFYDLGSGSGLACLTTALSSYQLSTIVGIEIVPSLANLSNVLLEKLLESLRKGINDSKEDKSPPSINNCKKEKNFSSIKTNKIFRSEGSRLFACINRILETEVEGMSVEGLANKLCKEIGHKQYRTEIRPYQSFLHVLRNRSDLYLVSDDGKFVLKKQIISPVDEISDSFDDFDNLDQRSNTVEEKHPEKTDELIIEWEICNFYHGRLPTVRLVEGDIFQYPWWDTADIVYVASLLFTATMMEELSFLALRMKEGSFFITLKTLPVIRGKHKEQDVQITLSLIHESFFKMSWQMAKVYIYRVCHENDS